VANTLRLSVVTPERELIDIEVTEVVVPGLDGYFGVLPGHAPLFSELAAGRLTYRHGGSSESLAVSGGFVEVLDDQVRVLASVAEARSQIDVGRANEAYRRARERLGGKGEDVDYERALAAADRASTRLEVSGQRPH
jgi:F-type H+-transporting ATPase subunit epsilon